MSAARHKRRFPDLRPLDQLKSIKIKLGVVVAGSSLLAVLITWLGLHRGFGPLMTVPFAVLVGLIISQLLAHGMVAPLRDMTLAARAMANGDYSKRVRATGRDEVGQLAHSFNSMAAELQQVDLTRREMVANVSHELRTPVAALQAQLENLVDRVTPADEQSLGAALEQTERLTRLMSYLLDMSRLEAGATGLRLRRVALHSFLHDVTTDSSSLALVKGIKIDIETRPEELTIVADPERLSQAIANLVNNAIRHSPPDEVIRVLAYRVGGKVIIDVVDRGPGIAKDDRERVFERFARAAASGYTAELPTGGTGLGLSIVRWAVQLHGGSVYVADSQVGCVMRVTLPLAGPGQ